MSLKITIIFIIVMFSTMVKGQTVEVNETKKIGQSATEWRQMYFIGLTKKPLDEIILSDSKVQGLLKIINANYVISSGVAIEPQYIFNTKGVTPWIAMYALVNHKDPASLSAIAEKKSRIHVPSNFLSNIFTSHVNWPLPMLKKYDISISGYNTFILPFLVHESHPETGPFSQSMKAPDGSLEIFTVSEFDENNPELFLLKLQDLMTSIKETYLVKKQP